MADGGREGPEDTWFHKKIISELCDKQSHIEVILTEFLLCRLQESKGTEAEGRTAASSVLRAREGNGKSASDATEEEKKQQLEGQAKRLQMQQLPKHYDPRSYY